MSKFYHVIHDCYGKWIKSPNNGGECCTTQEDTVEALKKLIQERDALQARVKRLEDELNDNGLVLQKLQDERDKAISMADRLVKALAAADEYIDEIQSDDSDYDTWICNTADARTAYAFAKQAAKESKP